MCEERGDALALEDPAERSRACAEIAASLPEWFGRPEANAHYAREIATKTCFAARSGDAFLGLIAIEPHFETAAEIWWLGVARAAHRGGLGRRLVERVLDWALEQGRRDVLVQTLSAAHPDPNYAATRRFYAAMGFAPLIDVPGDPPMMWMLRRL